MSKLFTKWLAVEKELQKGDAYYQKSDIGRKIWENFRPSSQILDMEDFQKVKLFLCSWDINEGEEFYHDELHYITPEKRTNYSKAVDLEGSLNFKTLGEISCDALSYVKEGMEFEEADINIIKFYDDDDYELLNVIVEIKGPCGHFH